MGRLDGADPRGVDADGATTTVNVVVPVQPPWAPPAGSTRSRRHGRSPCRVPALQRSAPRDPVDASGLSGISVDYDVVDLDADNGGAQQFALQTRVGGTGGYTSVATGYVADASGAWASDPRRPVLPSAAAVSRRGHPHHHDRHVWVGFDDGRRQHRDRVRGHQAPIPAGARAEPFATTFRDPGFGPADRVGGPTRECRRRGHVAVHRADVVDSFFAQEEDGRRRPPTSDGLLVFCGGNCPAVAAGDMVAVTGTGRRVRA